MQSLLLCAESIDSIEWSASYYKSFTKSVSLAAMILMVVNGTSICTCGCEWWSTWISCEVIVIYYDTCDGFWCVYDVYDIYMCYWWYIRDVRYIYFLFVWMECRKQIKSNVFGHFVECCTQQRDSLPSVLAITLGKVAALGNQALPIVQATTLGKPKGFAECPYLDTRQTWCFAKCPAVDTRQTWNFA